MKIAFASDDQITIASHFGRTRGFMIYSLEGQKVLDREYRPNTFTGHAVGMAETHQGTDKHRSILDALSDCRVVIARGMGQRIYTDLRNAGITAMITEQQTIETALTYYLEGQLMDHPDRGCSHD